jgi:hypothetical protein
LNDRIKRSVCVVDNLHRANENDAAKEIQIEKQISVRELLIKVGMEKWSGGQPQLRILKRDAIIQSPLQSDTSPSKNDEESFMKQELVPGDFLIITFIT